MIDPFDLWNSFQSLVNTFQGGWYRPQTDFIQACNDLGDKFWVKETDEAGKSQKARDNLMPFTKTHNYKVDNTGVRAFFKVDKDYGRFSSARIVVHKGKIIPDPKVEGGRFINNSEFADQTTMTQEYYDELEEVGVDLIDDIKWAAVNQHKTKGPSMSKGYIRVVEGGFQVLPRKISAITLTYYRKPKPATFNYTLSPANVQTGAGDQIIYQSSDPIEWPFSMRDEFLIGLGERYGLFTRDQFVTQYSMSKAV